LCLKKKVLVHLSRRSLPSISSIVDFEDLDIYSDD
jgi:hypothetical protein